MYARFLPRKASLWRCCSRTGLLLHSCLYPAQTSKSSHINGASSSLSLMIDSNPRRLYATRSAADRYLLELLNSEIEQTKHTLLKENGKAKEEMVGSFVLTDKAGMEDVVLSRTNGKEKIEILCMLEKQYPEDEDEPDEQKLQHRHHHHYNKQKNVMHEEDLEIVEVLHLSVIMSKGGDECVELDCSFVRGANELMIEEVMLYESDPALATEDTPEPYGGPIFEDLDEELQRAFHELLKDRGLTAKIAWYMMDYMSDKEQREYVRWLQRLRDFLTS